MKKNLDSGGQDDLVGVTVKFSVGPELAFKFAALAPEIENAVARMAENIFQSLDESKLQGLAFWKEPSLFDARMPKARAFISARLPNAVARALQQLAIEAVIHSHPSKVRRHQIDSLTSLARDNVKQRLAAPGPGRPEESAAEFLEKISRWLHGLEPGAKQTQTAAARSLGCDPRNLRARQKKHGFKDWSATLNAIRMNEEL